MPLGAGLPALAVLGGTTAGALLLGAGVLAAGNDTGSGMEMPSPLKATARRLQLHAVLVGVVSLVFWAWAAYNCVSKRSFDLGVVSFFTVIVASVCGWKRASNPAEAGSQQCLMGGSCAFVVFNYSIGLVLVSKPPTLRLYFGIAALWWAVACAVSVCCLRIQRRQASTALLNNSEN